MRSPDCSKCPLDGTHARVSGDGPLDAELLVVAEAPGQNEVEQGRPLVGWTGTFVNECLAYYAFPRNKIRVENIFEHKAPYASKDGKKAASMCGRTIWDIIAQMPNLRTIIAFGEASLRELGGYREWEERDREYKAQAKAYASYLKRRAKAQVAYHTKLTKWEDALVAKRKKYADALRAWEQRRAEAEGAKRAFKRKPPKEPKYPKSPEWPKVLSENFVEPQAVAQYGVKGITNYRGSPLWVYGHGPESPKPIRLFPIIHPAACAPKRQPRLRPLIMHDIRRATEFHRGLRTEVEPQIVAIRSAQELRAFSAALPSGRIGLDIEWSRKHNELVSIGIGTDRVGVIVFFTEEFQMPSGERAECFQILQDLFLNQKLEWGGHFVGYDEYKLSTVGLTLRSKWDSLYSFHILHADLGSAKDEESEEIEKGKRKLGNSSASGYSLGFVGSVLCDAPYHKDMLDRDAAELPLDTLVEYNGRDVWLSWQAQRAMDAEGAKTMPEGLFQSELDEEMELTCRASKMSRRGVPINEPERQARLAKWTVEQDRIAAQARQHVDDSGFNLGSGPQLALYLERSGIKVRRSKDTNNPMLDGNEIQKLIRRHPSEPLLQLVQAYRRAEKEQTGYGQLEPGWDGKAHPSWKVHGTVGTRWSSTPNYQNLTKEQRQIIG